LIETCRGTVREVLVLYGSLESKAAIEIGAIVGISDDCTNVNNPAKELIGALVGELDNILVALLKSISQL
jgi:hypothetical protein